MIPSIDKSNNLKAAMRFTTPGSTKIYISQDFLVELLVVGGGGSGGDNCGGGGGAGAVVFQPQTYARAGTYYITVGSGGSSSSEDGGSSSIQTEQYQVLYSAIGGGSGATDRSSGGHVGGSSGGGNPFLAQPAPSSSDNVFGGNFGIGNNPWTPWSQYVAGNNGGIGESGCGAMMADNKTDYASCNGGGGGGAGKAGLNATQSLPGGGGDGTSGMLGVNFGEVFGKAYNEVAVWDGKQSSLAGLYIAGGGGAGNAARQRRPRRTRGRRRRGRGDGGRSSSKRIGSTKKYGQWWGWRLLPLRQWRGRSRRADYHTNSIS